MIQKIDISTDKDILKSIPLLIDMLDIRIALETRALKLAIPNMAQSDFDRAKNILALYQANDYRPRTTYPLRRPTMVKRTLHLQES